MSDEEKKLNKKIVFKNGSKKNMFVIKCQKFLKNGSKFIYIKSCK